MIKQDPLLCGDRGWIVNTASVFGLGGSPGVVGYVSSKHAVMGVTKAAARDCAPYRIHVSALCPGCEYIFNGLQADEPLKCEIRGENKTENG